MQWFRWFMAGRYGSDSLNRFLSVVSVILFLLSMLTGWPIWYSLAMFFLVCGLFRMFSRNAWKRSRENQLYLLAGKKIAAIYTRLTAGYRQRKTHRIYKCKSCGTALRVPKRRGRMIITCPRCRASFEKRS